MHASGVVRIEVWMMWSHFISWWRYGALIMGVLISLSYGCSTTPITSEKIIQKLHALVRTPNIRFNYARFYHQGNHSIVSIHYKNAGTSPAYSVVTDLKVYLDAKDVPIEQDSLRLEPILAPNAHPRELRGVLPDTFFEKVTDGKGKLTMEFGAQYQNDQGKQFVSFSVWQFSKFTLEPFLVEEKLNLAVQPSSKS